MNGDIIIIIPIYKEQLKPSELISLNHVRNILHRYKICFIAPRGKRFSYVRKNESILFFSPHYFVNTVTYSELLLSVDFYMVFRKYTYMYIHQLDVFVFKKNLSFYCEKNYDYIGAPMLWRGWTGKHIIVGNGGSSLRKVESCIGLLTAKDEVFSASTHKDELERDEDLFFSFAALKRITGFKAAPIEVAIKFSIEQDVCKYYDKINNNNLPFSCHKWNSPIYFPIWSKYIHDRITNEEWLILQQEMASYPKIDYKSERRKLLGCYLIDRLLRGTNHIDYKIKGITGENVIFWGNGRVVESAMKIFQALKFKIFAIADKKHSHECPKRNVKVIYSDKDMLKYKMPIIITSIKYEKEMEENLINWNLKKGKDFFVFSEIRKDLIDYCYQKLKY